MADFIVGMYIEMDGQVTVCHHAGLSLQLLHRTDKGTGKHPGKEKYAQEQDEHHCCYLHNGGVEYIHDLAAVIFYHQSPAHAAYRG